MTVEKLSEKMEIELAIQRVDLSLPKPEFSLTLRPIIFEEGFKQIGYRAALTAGTAIGTDGKALLVPERTLKILDELKVKYEVIK